MTKEEIKHWLEIELEMWEDECKSEHPIKEALSFVIKTLESEPISDKYEYHIDHTDCIWYGYNNGCPATCSQYRDGWNDAMKYIFKEGRGYQPYRRKEK